MFPFLTLEIKCWLGRLQVKLQHYWSFDSIVRKEMIFKLFIVSQKSIYTEIFKMAEDSIKAERLSRLEDYFSIYYSPFA